MTQNKYVGVAWNKARAILEIGREEDTHVGDWKEGREGHIQNIWDGLIC